MGVLDRLCSALPFNFNNAAIGGRPVNPISLERWDLPPGLERERTRAGYLLTWTHTSPEGKKSKAQFLIDLPDEKGERALQQRIIKAYERDYLKVKSADPVNTAFFESLSGLKGSELVCLEGVSTPDDSDGFIVTTNTRMPLVLRNCTLRNIPLEITTGELIIDQVTFSGGVPQNIASASTRIRSSAWTDGVLLSGDFGQAVIDGKSTFACLAGRMNFLKTVWEDPNNNIRTRVAGSFVFSHALVTPKFLEQLGGYQEANAVEFERRREKIDRGMGEQN